MLWSGKKKYARLWIGSKAVQAMWLGAVKIWGAVAASCFGSGVWLPSKPWIGTDKWKPHK